MKRRDANDVRKVDGQFTTGWKIVQALTLLLIVVAVAGILIWGLVVFYAACGALIVIGIGARVVIARDRRRYYVESAESEDRLPEID